MGNLILHIGRIVVDGRAPDAGGLDRDALASAIAARLHACTPAAQPASDLSSTIAEAVASRIEATPTAAPGVRENADGGR